MIPSCQGESRQATGRGQHSGRPCHARSTDVRLNEREPTGTTGAARRGHGRVVSPIAPIRFGGSRGTGSDGRSPSTRACGAATAAIILSGWTLRFPGRPLPQFVSRPARTEGEGGPPDPRDGRSWAFAPLFLHRSLRHKEADADQQRPAHENDNCPLESAGFLGWFHAFLLRTCLWALSRPLPSLF